MSDESEESFLQVLLHSWHRSWLLRMIAYGIGAILILAGLSAQGYFEYQGVQKAKSLEKGATGVASVSPDKIDPANDGKLVHVVGEATTKETLEDPDFDVKVNAIRLVRKVEMYQWQEKKESKKKGKETVVSYHYDQIWSAKPISSKSFNDRGHDNPEALPFEDKTWKANEVTLGAFAMPQTLVDKLKIDERLPAADTAKFKALDGLYYTSADPAKPATGDARVEFKVLKPGTVSAIAKQGKSGMEPYQDSDGNTIELAQAGTHTADTLFTAEASKQAMTVWVTRVLGFLLLAAGLYLFLAPRVNSADTMPLGEVLALGGIAAGVVFGLVVSLVLSGAILIMHQPVMTVAFLVVAAVAVVVARFLGARKQAQADGTAQLPKEAARVARKIRKGGGQIHVYDAGQNASITLSGPKFNDDFIAELNAFPKITTLMLFSTGIKGAGLANLRDVKSLTYLTVSGPFTDQGLKVVGTMTALTNLTINDSKITDQGLALLKGLTRLESADFSDTLISDAGLVHVKGWVNLTSFSLTGSPITGTGLDNLKDLKKLERLHLFSNKLTDPGLAGLKNLKSLKSLTMGINEIDGRGLGYLQGLTLLERLDIDHSKVDDKGLPFLAKLPALKELSLERTKVTDAGMAHLKAIPLLEKLELYKTGITDKGIAQLAGKTTITELCIDRTKVTDACLPAMARLPNLRTLHLDHTGVTDNGLVHLKGLMNLSWITMSNTKVTRKGRDDLKAAIPGADIDSLGGSGFDENGWRGLGDAVENQAEEEEAKEAAKQKK